MGVPPCRAGNEAGSFWGVKMSNRFETLEIRCAETGEIWEGLNLPLGSIDGLNAAASDAGCSLSELMSRGIKALDRLLTELPENQCNEAGLEALMASRAASMGKTWETVQL